MTALTCVDSMLAGCEALALFPAASAVLPVRPRYFDFPPWSVTGRGQQSREADELLAQPRGQQRSWAENPAGNIKMK